MTNRALDGFLCCLVGANQYALHGADVTVVARAEDMRPQPLADAGRIGSLTRRGIEIPIYSLAGLLGGRSESHAGDRHIIVTGGEDAYGLLVDRIVRAPDADAKVLPLPSIIGGAAARWFGGLLSLQETSCLVLSPDGLRPGGTGPARGAVVNPASGRVPDPEIRTLVLTFSSAALPPLPVAHYAVGAARVSAVVQSMPLVALPGREPHIAALGAWRQSAVAALDFSSGGAVTVTSKRFLVARCDDGALVALPVDADITLRRATSRDGSAATVAPPGYVRGIFHVGDEDVALLDVDRLSRGGAAPAPAAAREAREAALV